MGKNSRLNITQNLHPHIKKVREERNKRAKNIKRSQQNLKNAKKKVTNRTKNFQIVSNKLNINEASQVGNAFITLFICSTVLIILGIVMVFSAQTITALNSGQNLFINLSKQIFIVLLSFFLAFLFNIVKNKNISKMSYIIFAIACFLQILVLTTPLGLTINGNRNWLNLGIITIQPSEFIKLSIILILSIKLSIYNVNEMKWKEIILNVLLMPILGMFLVLISKDAGTAMIMGIIIVGILYLINFNKKKFSAVLIISIIGCAFLFLSSSTKLARLMAVLNPNGCDPQGVCYQTNQAAYAMANGGLFGVGLGGSKEKWLRLSAADNDFIYAIIGEELGLFGCLFVLMLFFLICLSLIKIIRICVVAENTSQKVSGFESIFAAGFFLWFFSQSFLNIAMVLRLFPVVGIPLPFVSSGGSSMMASILAIGMMFRFIPHYSRRHILSA